MGQGTRDDQRVMGTDLPRYRVSTPTGPLVIGPRCNGMENTSQNESRGDGSADGGLAAHGDEAPGYAAPQGFVGSLARADAPLSGEVNQGRQYRAERPERGDRSLYAFPHGFVRHAA